MIGKSEWFERRRYGGWGVRPCKWQGWAYVAAMIIPLVAVNAIGGISNDDRNVVMGAWIALIILDTIDIMAHLKKDERSFMHEAISERNSSWFMVIVLSIGFAYRIIDGARAGRVEIDPVIAVALVGAVIVKAATNYVLERRN